MVPGGLNVHPELQGFPLNPLLQHVIYLFSSKVPTHGSPSPSIFGMAIPMSAILSALAISLFLPPVLAQDDGSDGMGMGMGDMEGGTMKTYLHFTPGDSVLFGPWIPQTSRAVFGTCVGVFLLGMVDRWFSATMAVMSAYWSKKVARAPPSELKAILSTLPAFVPKYDIPRGIASLGTKSVQYTLMLIVMTQNASFFISVVLGLGFGEMLFGRYRYATHSS